MKEGMGLWAGVVAMVVIVVSGLLAIGDIQQEERYRQSCMDNVHTPDPQASDYDQQAIDFSVEIRKCMRG